MLLAFLIVSLIVLVNLINFTLIGYIYCRWIKEEDECEEPEDESALFLVVTIEDFKIKSTHMALTLTTTQFAEATLEPQDRRGRPAPVEAGSVSFTSSDESVFTVEEDPTNELKVKITAVGEGVAQLDYTADADLGEGVVSISGFAAIEVLPASAVGFGVSFGAAQEQDFDGEGTTSSSSSTSSSTTESTTEAPVVEPIL